MQLLATRVTKQQMKLRRQTDIIGRKLLEVIREINKTGSSNFAPLNKAVDRDLKIYSILTKEQVTHSLPTEVLVGSHFVLNGVGESLVGAHGDI